MKVLMYISSISQTYASEKPCIVCHQFLTKKSSSYWEGGRGCRDKIRMSR